MTQRPPGNHYTKHNNQRCKYIAVAKAGGRPWTLSFRNTGLFFVKTLPLRIHGERCSAIPAGWVWMGNCAARRMRWEFSWRSGYAHKTNRFTLGVAVTPTTSFIAIITIFAFFFPFVYVFLDFFVHLHFVALIFTGGEQTGLTEVIMTHSTQTANSWNRLVTWHGSQELRNIWEGFNY